MFNGIHTADSNGDASFINNCFPVRYNVRVRNANPASNGAWMVVYRNNQKKQLKAVLCSDSKTFEDVKRQREIAEVNGMRIQDVELKHEVSPTPSARMQRGKALSKEWLLKQLKIVHPGDVSVVRIESCDLTRVEDGALQEFENVVHIKAADNILPIDAFAKFPALETLELQMNLIGSASTVTSSRLSIESANLSSGEIYPNLRHLVLDFNDLGAADFDTLSYLAHLENLSCVSNKLRAFPPPDYQRLEANLFFPSLMVLDVSDNAISINSDFLYLCGMPKLQHLIISNNGIKGIPSIHFTGHRYAIVPSRHNFDSPPDMMGMGMQSPGGVLAELDEESARALSTIAETTSERSSPALLLLPPFPELTVTDLSDNLIASDMALAGILSWPSLKQVILDGNPLAKRDERTRRRARRAQEKSQNTDTTSSSICEFLEQSLGIDVVRSKSDLRKLEEAARKPPSNPSNVLQRFPNLEAKIPKVPKCDVDKLLALCAPPPFESPNLSPPAIPPTIREEEAIHSPVSEEGHKKEDVRDTVGDASIQFFMTELAPDMDVAEMRAECEKSLLDEDALQRRRAKHAESANSQALAVYDPRFQGYEELFIEDDNGPGKDLDNDMLERMPTTLQDSVHALRTILDLPSVSRRPEAAIEAWASRQLAARRKVSSSTLQTMSAVGRVNDPEPIRYERFVSRMAALGPRVTRTYTQLVDGIISNQRGRETMAEASLGSVLNDGRSRRPKMYRSARRLLRQITSQYDDLRKNLDQVAASSARNILNNLEDQS